MSSAWIGGLLEKMPATHFWLLHAALCGTAGIIFIIAAISSPRGENEIGAPLNSDLWSRWIGPFGLHLNNENGSYFRVKTLH
jgi:hypothetical protein